MPLTARLQIFDGKFANSLVPASLRHRISDKDWEALVLAIDHAMSLDRLWQRIGLSLCLGVPLLVLVLVVAMAQTQFGDPWAFLRGIPPFLFVIFFIMMVSHEFCIRPKVISDVNRVLTEASFTYPGISFHLMGHGTRKDPFYIEVFEEQSGKYYSRKDYGSTRPPQLQVVDLEANSSNNTQSLLASTNTAPPSTRLEELEKVKHLLSRREYNDKRQAILADI